MAACSALGFLSGLGTGYGNYGGYGSGYPGNRSSWKIMKSSHKSFIYVVLTLPSLFYVSIFPTLGYGAYGGNYGKYGGGIFKTLTDSFIT